MKIETLDKRNKSDRELSGGAVRILEETGKPIVQIARDVGVNEASIGIGPARQAREGRDGLSSDEP